jgi:sialate O-acetylesterase
MNIGNQLKGRLCLALAFCTLGTLPIHAQVRLPNVFSDHMVLQQQQENKVWGRASANELVTVTIADQKHSTTADANGDWQVKLRPLTAGGPHELTVSASNTIEIADVLVGEVWICSGQSNMQWNVQQSIDPDLEKLTAKFPNIRMINFPQVGSQEPIWEHPKSKWQVCSPESVSSFSAVGYSFARQLHLALDVPIGMINNAWGGSACEAWISRNTLQSAGAYDELLAHWDSLAREADELSANDNSQSDEVKKKRSGLQGRLQGNHRPGNIYNGVLKSHLGYGIRGAIWYQGESNASRAYQYRDLFPLMISSWRQEWGQGDFPFYWVQLADFKPESADPMESDWAELREAQTMTQDRLPKTGQAVIIDIGEGKDIHPQNKSDVGKRLARLALANDYSVDVAAQSPRFQSMEKQGNKIVLTFSHASGGWRPFDVSEPVGFAIAGEDKKFVWATANVLSDHRIEVFHSQIPNPQAVRYGWADNPKCNMYSRAGLPLTPFRTDDWPGVTINNKK